ncbi:Regulator of chromosome condensation (RCC1) family protein [Forsythia ovata]|uniref:Regulator of chromosome condensation (RCC1) family protein n=1 Tax=Forsythia ovata TaxID=205694 RepID=A0ABD1PWF8_9LAMI
MASVETENKGEQEELTVKGGELLFCGTTAWDEARGKGSQERNLISPTRLRPLMGVHIRYVASGCVSCHCVALDVEGRCYTWGRNEKGQLGHGDTIQRDMPTIVSELSKHKVIRAGAGRSHTVVVTEDGLSLAFGWNKHGQLGSGSVKNEVEPSPVRCLVSEVKTTVCGGDFTVWLTPVEGASILTAGLPQYGQLGHGTDKEYNTKDSSVRLAYEAQPSPQTIASLAGETIVKVACGLNHTVAVDKNGYVYTWGFGGYGRLGHREQKDEWVPRRVDVFTKHNILPPDAIVSAGSANSSCTAGGGQLYMWGKMKISGDDWMYPKPLMDLSGWHLRCMDSGNMHHFVGADSSCISWGLAKSGELGYGPKGQKSSASPKKVEILEGMHVFSVACGYAHSMVVVDRTNVADRLEQLEVYDGKGSDKAVPNEPDKGTYIAEKSTRKSSAKKSESSKKRKNSDSSSDSEDEESSDYESEGELNGQAKHGRKRGGKGSGEGRGKSPGKSSAEMNGSGHGRGRPPSMTKNSPSTGGKGSGKRGRPRKS